jgi:hypothetical protein
MSKKNLQEWKNKVLAIANEADTYEEFIHLLGTSKSSIAEATEYAPFPVTGTEGWTREKSLELLQQFLDETPREEVEALLEKHKLASQITGTEGNEQDILEEIFNRHINCRAITPEAVFNAIREAYRHQSGTDGKTLSLAECKNLVYREHYAENDFSWDDLTPLAKCAFYDEACELYAKQHNQHENEVLKKKLFIAESFVAEQQKTLKMLNDALCDTRTGPTCTSCGLSELITDNYCNCCGGKQD